MLGENLNIIGTGSEKPPERSEDVGARLRAAREARDMELRDIAATTKISIGALEAVEQNDFGPLPGGIFTRAFVRAYAAEVGLDPEQTTRDFMAQAPTEAALDTALQLDGDRRPSTRHVVEAVIKVLVVGVPLAGLMFLGMRSMSGNAPAAEDAAAPGGGGPETAVGRPASASPAPPTEAKAVPTAPEPLTIVLRPGGESWVSLTVDGEQAVSRIMQAGEEESHEAEGEIRLNVGNAGEFDFTLNGEDGRSLGDPGQVATVVITRDNYRSFLSP